MSLPKPLAIRFEGDSGDGILSMGRIVARTAARLGYHVYTYSTFLAVVRGGQVTFQVRIGTEPLLSQGNEPEILVALNRQAVKDTAHTMKPGSIVMHPNFQGPPEPLPEGVNGARVDFREISESETGSPRSKNVVAAGAVLGMLDMPEESAADIVRDIFQGKSADVIDSNLVALAAGFKEGCEQAKLASAMRLAPTGHGGRMLISGNEAVALGALAAGVRFFAGYPITPASEIMEWLAKELPKVGGAMFQAEDEIAALAMCIGASYGGVKTMTATSGPGLSLMIELLGLAGMAEIPIVVVDVQRAGPSTGMPTKEAQGDLIQAAHGTHGEVPRVIIAPHTVADCFTQTIRAVNLAHEFHIPVILLSSQSLSHRMQTIDPEELKALALYEEPFYQGVPDGGEPFLRYKEQAEGRASVRSIPGMPGGMYRAGGLEHSEDGNPDFEPALRRRMVERRRLRMRAIAKALRGSTPTFGPKDETHFGIMSWGASASVVGEAVQQLGEHGVVMRTMLPHVLWPMPDLAIRTYLASGIKTLFIVELNATRQYAEMLRARYTRELVRYGIEVVSINKDEGLPFTPYEVIRGVLDHLRRPEPLRVSR